MIVSFGMNCHPASQAEVGAAGADVERAWDPSRRLGSRSDGITTPGVAGFSAAVCWARRTIGEFTVSGSGDREGDLLGRIQRFWQGFVALGRPRHLKVGGVKPFTPDQLMLLVSLALVEE